MDKIAVLIPCYNESKTIAKVVSDFKNALPEAESMYMTIIPVTIRMRSQKKQVPSFATNTSREKEM